MALGWKGKYLRYKELFLNIYSVYKTKPDIKMFLEILLSLATISFFGLFALKPALLTISGLLVEIKGKEETVQKMDQKIQDLATAKAVFDKEADRIPLVSQAVPDGPGVNTLVNQLIATSYSLSLNIDGLTLADVTLVGKDPKRRVENVQPMPENANEINFSISVSGPYQSLLSFISNLENLRLPISFDTTNFSTSKKIDTQFLVLVISGRTPYLEQD